MNLAQLFGSSKQNRRRPPAGRGDLAKYQRTYGEKDGRTVFEAQQIKAKRKRKR